MKAARLLVVAFACVLALVGCAGKGSLSDKIDDDTGAYTFTADDAGKGSAVGSFGGGIDIENGQILAVSPDLEKGSLQLKLLNEANETVLDENVTGRQITTYELGAGSYSISVACNEDGTTGTLLVVPVNADEFEKQNKDLEAALSSADVSTDAVSSTSN